MPDDPLKRRRVLLIDDDHSQFSCMRELFSLFRGELYFLDWAPTYEDGLTSLMSGRYCACLLDYQLGERNGIDLLKEATAAQCHTPVIIVTGWSGGDIDMEAVNAGATDYLVKGELNPRTLERSLRYAIKMDETLQALRQAATHDELTTLLNRRELDRLLTEEIQRSRRFQRCFSVTLIDLDHFKRINDTKGHRVGDRVLQHVASILQKQVRSTDKVARYGGEEFALVQIETDNQAAMSAANRLRATLASTPFVLPNQGERIAVTLSAGVATYPGNGQNTENLLQAADQALYEAKARGRDCAVSANEFAPPSEA